MTLQSLILIIALLLATALSALAFGLFSTPFLAFEAACCTGLALVNRRDRLIERWQRGASGEMLVGSVLEGMSNDGWLVLHDVSLGRGNIDHIAIGPAGLFTIETKSHPGRIAIDRIEPRMLKQAWAEKKLLENITSVHVEALLVFSRAYLQGRVPARRGGVMVLPARMLAGHLKRRKLVYSPEQIQALYERLALALC